MEASTGQIRGLSTSSHRAVRMVVATGDDNGVDRRWSSGDRGSRTAALVASVASASR